jgi:hypothetical protein
MYTSSTTALCTVCSSNPQKVFINACMYMYTLLYHQQIIITHIAVQ